MSTNHLAFDSCAESLAKVLATGGAAEMHRIADDYERNLGWDARKLVERAKAISTGPRGLKPLSDLPAESGWVKLWRIRDDEWQSFVGRIAVDGAVEYPAGGRSLHNTVTHWTPLDKATEPRGAQAHLDTEAAITLAVPVKEIDGDMDQDPTNDRK